MKFLLILTIALISKINPQDNHYMDISYNLAELSERLGEYSEVIGYSNDANHFILHAQVKYSEVRHIILSINLMIILEPDIKESRQDWFKSLKVEYFNFWVSDLKYIKESLLNIKDMLNRETFKKNIDQGIKNIDMIISELKKDIK